MPLLGHEKFQNTMGWHVSVLIMSLKFGLGIVIMKRLRDVPIFDLYRTYFHVYCLFRSVFIFSKSAFTTIAVSVLFSNICREIHPKQRVTGQLITTKPSGDHCWSVRLWSWFAQVFKRELASQLNGVLRLGDPLFFKNYVPDILNYHTDYPEKQCAKPC